MEFFKFFFLSFDKAYRKVSILLTKHKNFSFSISKLRPISIIYKYLKLKRHSCLLLTPINMTPVFNDFQTIEY